MLFGDGPRKHSQPGVGENNSDSRLVETAFKDDQGHANWATSPENPETLVTIASRPRRVPSGGGRDEDIAPI